MAAALRRWLCAAGATVLAVVAVWAADPPAPSGGAAATGPAPRGLDALNLPADAVVVVCEEVKNALALIPRSVILTPERYKALLDEIDRLKKKAAPDKPVPPTACKLTGRVEGDFARFQAEFRIHTDKPNTPVLLG